MFIMFLNFCGILKESDEMTEKTKIKYIIHPSLCLPPVCPIILKRFHGDHYWNFFLYKICLQWNALPMHVNHVVLKKSIRLDRLKVVGMSA